MTHLYSWRAGLAIPLALALVAASPSVLHAQQGTPVPQARAETRVRSDTLADRFGLTLPTNAIEAVGLGDCLTGTLDAPARLEAFGLRGMHAGARVTILRTAPDRLHVEADELEPVAKRVQTVVRLDARGVPIPKPTG